MELCARGENIPFCFGLWGIVWGRHGALEEAEEIFFVLERVHYYVRLRTVGDSGNAVITQ